MTDPMPTGSPVEPRKSGTSLVGPEKIGLGLIALAVLLGFIGPSIGAGTVCGAVPLSFVGGVVAMKGNGKRKGKPNSFVMTWLMPLLGSVGVLVLFGMMGGAR